MHDMTAANLRSAYGGESMAHMRYQSWGDLAELDGKPNIARLFRAISFAEKVHASNHFVELKDCAGDALVPAGAVFGIGGTAANLDGAVAGESYEIEEMYPAFLEVAKFQKEKGAVRSFTYALNAEKEHEKLFSKARQAALEEEDIQLGAVRICRVCGYTLEGDIPEKCLICGVGREYFESFGASR